jgi:hypothetical protein
MTKGKITMKLRKKNLSLYKSLNALTVVKKETNSREKNIRLKTRKPDLFIKYKIKTTINNLDKLIN